MNLKNQITQNEIEKSNDKKKKKLKENNVKNNCENKMIKMLNTVFLRSKVCSAPKGLGFSLHWPLNH